MSNYLGLVHWNHRVPNILQLTFKGLCKHLKVEVLVVDLTFSVELSDYVNLTFCRLPFKPGWPHLAWRHLREDCLIRWISADLQCQQPNSQGLSDPRGTSGDPPHGPEGSF